MGLFDFLSKPIKFSSEPLSKIFGLKEPIKFTSTVGKVLAATAVVGAGAYALSNSSFVSGVLGSTGAGAAAGTASTATGIASIGTSAAGIIGGVAIPVLAKVVSTNVLSTPTVQQQIANGGAPIVGTKAAVVLPAGVAAQDNTMTYVIGGAALVIILLAVRR